VHSRIDSTFFSPGKGGKGKEREGGREGGKEGGGKKKEEDREGRKSPNRPTIMST